MRRAFDRLHETWLSVKTWRHREQHFVGLFIGTFHSLGLWPGHSKHARGPSFLKWLTLAWIIFLHPFFCTVCLISAFLNRQSGFSLDFLAPALSVCLSLVFVFCLAVLRLYGRQIQEAVDDLDCMIDKGSRLPWQPAKVARRAKNMSELFVGYYVFGSVGIATSGLSMFVSTVAKKRDNPFMFRIWLPFEPTLSPYFELVTLSFNVTVVFGMHLVLTLYAFIMLLMGHAVGQFQLLNVNLRLVGWEAMEDKNTFVMERLGRCVIHHQAILRFVSKLERAFSSVLLNQFNCSLTPTILSIVLINQIATDEFDLRIALGFLPLIGSLSNQWIFCWLGEKITAQSELVRDSIFDSDWVGWGPGLRRSMGIIISRSNQPSVVRVGGFVPLSLSSFYAVMKLSYTTYMSMVETRQN